MSNNFFFGHFWSDYFFLLRVKETPLKDSYFRGRGFACYRTDVFYFFNLSTLKFFFGGGYFPQAHNFTSVLCFLQYPSKIFLMVHSIVLKNDITTNQETPGSSDYRGMSLGWMYFRHLSLEHMTQGFWRRHVSSPDQFLRHIM